MPRILLCTLTVSVLCSGTLVAQNTSDFTGTWVMDMTRSELAAQGVDVSLRTPPTLVITQSRDQIAIETHVNGLKRLLTYSFEPPQEPSHAADTSGSAQSNVLTASAEWREGRLVTTTVFVINGMATTQIESRRLADNGREMIVETLVKPEHGYSFDHKYAKNDNLIKDVYIKSVP